MALIRNRNDTLLNAAKFLKHLCRNRSSNSPFAVGCLKFDDFNYDYINSIISVSHDNVPQRKYGKSDINYLDR